MYILNFVIAFAFLASIKQGPAENEENTINRNEDNEDNTGKTMRSDDISEDNEDNTMKAMRKR